MGSSKRTRKARKASYIAFGLVALAAVSCASSPEEETKPAQIIDTTAEATRAYRQAVVILNHLNAPYAYREDHIDLPYSIHNYAPSFWSAFLPNVQGQGPVANAFRILLKLRHQSLLPKFITRLSDTQSSSRRRDDDLNGRAVKVLDLLQHAADLGHGDALYTLAKVSLFPPNPHFPSDPALAFKSFSEHASLTGNATSQGYLGFLYSTGYGNATAPDQAKAQLYSAFAGHGGDKGSQMTIGYKYWSGIGVAEDCMSALRWYEDAAGQAIAKFQSGPPGGLTLPLIPPRLSDLEGGVFGPGASVASTGLNAARPVIKTAGARAAGETWEDLLEYYSYNADRGELDFAYRLGKIFYQGAIYNGVGGIASGGDGASRVPRDFHRARQYFLTIARQIWPRDPANPRMAQPSAREQGHQTSGYAAAAAGYIGRMFLRGEGVRQDPVLAKMWFERGAEFGEKESHNGLGIIWRDGLVDGRKDMKKALQHFNIAAGQDLAEAQVHVGKYHYEHRDFKAASAYFEAAIRQGSPFEAYYYLADIQARMARTHSDVPDVAAGYCSIATSFFKLVAERGVWDDNILRDAEIAWNTGTEQGKELALLYWWIAAERGMEVAQNNLAFALDQDRSILKFTRFAPYGLSNDTARLALTQWTRSAAQHNIDSLVKVGDYYYHGLGVPDEPSDIRFEKAAGFYQSAAQTSMSALALWNLGYMYENGVGVPQDYHLAKRHYDSALTVNSEAYIPVTLSLMKLQAKSLWYALIGGADNLNLWHYDEESENVYNTPPRAAEIEDGREQEDQPEARQEGELCVDGSYPDSDPSTRTGTLEWDDMTAVISWGASCGSLISLELDNVAVVGGSIMDIMSDSLDTLRSLRVCVRDVSNAAPMDELLCELTERCTALESLSYEHSSQMAYAFMVTAPSRCPTIRRLRLSGLFVHGVLHLVERCTHLEVLEVVGHEVRIDSMVWANLIASDVIPTLRQLTISPPYWYPRDPCQLSERYHLLRVACGKRDVAFSLDPCWSKF